MSECVDIRDLARYDRFLQFGISNARVSRGSGYREQSVYALRNEVMMSRWQLPLVLIFCVAFACATPNSVLGYTPESAEVVAIDLHSREGLGESPAAIPALEVLRVPWIVAGPGVASREGMGPPAAGPASFDEEPTGGARLATSGFLLVCGF